jgi:hypothetical protein
VTTEQRDIQRAVNLDLEYPRDAAAKISESRLGHTVLTSRSAVALQSWLPILDVMRVTG